MSYQNIFKRYELKYLITKEEQELLKSLMGEYMEADKFGKNIIRNIYFDTPDKLLIRRSLEKPVYKEKLRVRCYGEAVSEKTVFVELKKKYNGIVYKRRMDLSEQSAMNYLCKRLPLESPCQISREIDCFYNLYKNIEPSIFISYEREAFYSDEDSNFRMTFDENIMFRDYDLSLKSAIYGDNILPQSSVLLEVKTALSIPIWLTEFLSLHKIYKISFSKYGNAYNKMLLTKSLGGEKYVA